MELSKLAPPKGAKRKRVRLGRGVGSGLGKTAGRGGKGQTARTGGKIRPGFEGGQMPMYRRLPKRGFTSRRRTLGKNDYQILNLSDLVQFKAGSVVDLPTLFIGKARHRAGVKLLGKGEIDKKLTVKVNSISASARQKIEAQGGSVELV